MTEPRVVQIKDHVKGAIRVDRVSDYGNPFVMHKESQRDEVCDRFIVYANWRVGIQPGWLALLRGKVLACHCVPKRCHADTLVRLANE